MSPYKKLVESAREFFDSVTFLKTLLSAHIFVFAAGALFYLLGLFIGPLYDAFVGIGSIAMWAGLLLCAIKQDVMTIVITSGIVALGSLVGWIVSLVGRSYFGYVFSSFAFTPFLYFLIFGAIAVLVLVKSERFREMRAAARAKGVICPKCGSVIPPGGAFCAACGTQAPPPQPPAAPETGTPRLCMSCGAELPTQAMFCSHCGAKQA